FQETPNYDSESNSSEDENESDISFDTQEYHTKNLSPNNMFKELIFGSAQRLQEIIDKLDFYLDLRRTPVAFPNIDPLLW
ncbi:22062_t:CDS:2, partial [Gigaspora margarita]